MPSPDFPYTLALLIAACLLFPAAALLWVKRKTLAWPSVCLIAGALIALALAAGGLRWSVPRSGIVMVLVDDSPSTRTAGYHDPAVLMARVRELLGKQEYRVEHFGKGATFTVLPPIAAPALLFSDGHFSPAAALSSPIYPVLDERLLEVNDNRVVEIREERGDAIAIIQENTLRTRINLGSATASHEIRVKGGDPWPENDYLEADQVPGSSVSRWAVGGFTPRGYTKRDAGDLPASPGGYASTAMLFLDADSAAGLSEQQQAAIVTWVRDLGGSVLLHSNSPRWTSLRGTAIEVISPLAVDPPRSTREWLVILDTSGSMSAEANGQPRWRFGLTAAGQAIRHLPASDTVRFATFSDQLRWWHSGLAGDFDLSLPAGFVSRGPTNLNVVMDTIRTLPPAQDRQVLLLTDAEIDPSHAVAPAGTRVHCLALSQGRGIEALRKMCELTGGQFAVEALPQNWAGSAAELVHSAGPSRWETRSLRVTTVAPLPVVIMQIAGWNAAFPRAGASDLARSDGQTLAATWRVGLGRVTTVSFGLDPTMAQMMAGRFEMSPVDNRYELTLWADKARVERISGDAPADLMLSIDGVGRHLVETAPGLYEFELPRDEKPHQLAISTADGEVISRRTLAPRYAKEFGSIGVDQAALEQLAERSGGAVITPVDRRPLPILTQLRFWSMVVPLGITAFLALAAAVITLRRRI